MSMNLHVDTVVGQSQSQLLVEQAQIIEQLQAELSSYRPIPLSKSPSSTSNNDRVHKHQHVSQRRSSNMSRGNSSSGVTPMLRQHSSNQVEAPQTRARNFAQISAPSMTRGNPKTSTSQSASKVPFTQNGAMPLPLYSQPENSVSTVWAQQDQLASEYKLYQQPNYEQQQQWSSQPRTTGLEQVRELEDLTDPSEYLRNMNTAYFVPGSMPIPLHHSVDAVQPSPTYAMPAPSPSLTCATTFAETMSRQESFCSEPFITQVAMMKFDSQSSSPDFRVDQSPYDQASQFPPLHSQYFSGEEQSKMLVGAGANHNSYLSQSNPTQSAAFGVEMEKSQSSESSTSVTMTRKLRNITRLQDQNRLANARPLVSKGENADNLMSRENSSQSMARMESRDGTQDRVALSHKSDYQRPKYPKVYCTECVEPQEFRGPHELARHKAREHAAPGTMTKRWICVEPTGDHHKIVPVMPLSRCKACSQKKKYNVDYNAAAHLRRAHFNPKPKGKKSSKQEDTEKKGVKGERELPVMDDLKPWMKEVQELAKCDDDTMNANSEEDIIDDMNPEDMLYYQHQMSTMPDNCFDFTYAGNNDSFDGDNMQSNYGDRTTANSYSSGSTVTDYPTAINNDYYTNADSMQVDFTNVSQQQCGMEQSMYDNLSVQNNFSSFSPEMYQQNMFYDTPSFPPQQLVGDQIFSGPGAVHYQY